MASITKRTYYKYKGARYWSQAALIGAGVNFADAVEVTKWMAQIRRAGHKPVARTFSTKKAAENWVRSTESEQDDSEFKDPRLARRISSKILLSRYEEDEARNHRGYDNSERYRIKSIRESKVVKGASLTDWCEAGFWKKYINHRLEENIHPDTIRRELTICRRILRLAKMPARFDENPVSEALELASLSPPVSRKRRLKGTEETRLLEAAAVYGHGRHKGWLLHYLLFAIDTAMRRGEIVQICEDWLDEVSWELHIPAEATKTGEPRVVPLTKEATTALFELKKMFQPLPGDPIIPYVAGTVTQAIDRITDRERIPNLRGQDLRHEGASRLIEKGLSVIEAQSVTGHATLEMLQRYVHPDPKIVGSKMRGEEVNARAVVPVAVPPSPQSQWYALDKNELEKLVWDMPTSKLAKRFKVSDVAIGKRCRILGVSKPPRGFWARVASGKIPHPGGVPTP